MFSLSTKLEVEVSQVQYSTFRSALSQPVGSGNYPTILTIHGIYGLQEMDVHFTKRLASQGYVVLAHGWQSNEQDPADQDIVEGIRKAIAFLKQEEKALPDQVGLIGVCRGGSIAMIAAAHIKGLKASVSFYGQAYYPFLYNRKPVSPIDLVDQITQPMLLVHGEEDTIFAAQESVDYCSALKSRGKIGECKLYSGARHGFFLKGHRNYHQQASEEAWIVLSEFLKKHLPA